MIDGNTFEILTFAHDNDIRVSGGRHTFVADVHYVTQSRTASPTTSVTILGSATSIQGIVIEPTALLNDDNFQMNLSAKSNSYRFDREKKALIVSGSCTKRGERYHVRITPSLEERPSQT